MHDLIIYLWNDEVKFYKGQEWYRKNITANTIIREIVLNGPRILPTIKNKRNNAKLPKH